MTVEEKNPTPRPGDPFTAQDGARLFAELSSIVERMKEDLRTVKGATATLQSQHLTILEAIARVERGLASSRFDRLELELREAELEKEVAEKNLKAKEEKLEKKREVKDHTIDTQDRFKTVASATYEEIEEKKRKDREAKIEDIKLGALKTLVNWGVIGIVGVVVSFILFLFRMYITGNP